MKEPWSLAGEVALITGAAAGIGKATAVLFASMGADTALVDLDQPGAELVAGTLPEGVRRVAIEGDVRAEKSVAEAFDRAERDLGVPTIVVNSAGVTPKHELVDTTVEQWDEIIQTNLRGAFVCTREAARAMLRAGRTGSIVQISSISSLVPAALGNGAYGASKAGVNALVRNAAYELARSGIRVNAVLPGIVRTEGLALRRSLQDVSGPGANDERWLLGWNEPEDIAHAALYLGSPAARRITGQTLVVDGGFLLT